VEAAESRARLDYESNIGDVNTSADGDISVLSSGSDLISTRAPR
jgi:hypothetical protein